MSHFVLFAAIPAEEIGADFAASVDTELTQRMLPYYEMTECSDYLEFSPDPDGSETNEDGDPGFYFNPNARWDWYSIGGRWPGMLWISESARDYLGNEGFGHDSGKEVAKGFRCVSGARIRDIRWDAMQKQARAALTERYHHLQQVVAGQIDPPNLAFLCKDGIYGWGNTLLLARGESLENYLTRHGAGPEKRFIPDMYAYLDRNGEWHSRGDIGWFGISTNDKAEEVWRTECRQFLDALQPDDVLVVVDCHI